MKKFGAAYFANGWIKVLVVLYARWLVSDSEIYAITIAETLIFSIMNTCYHDSWLLILKAKEYEFVKYVSGRHDPRLLLNWQVSYKNQ